MMYHYCKKYFSLTFLFIFLFSVSFNLTSNAQDDAAKGEALFNANCTQCHKVYEKVIGPALTGVDTRHSEEWLLKWIKNSQSMVKAGDPEAVKLFNDNNKSVMTAFPGLKDDDVKNILAYVKTAKPPVAATGAKANDEEGAEEKPGNAWLWLLVAAIVLYLLSGVLRRVQETLAKTVRQRDGMPEPGEQTRMQRYYNWARFNKKLLAIILILLTIVGSVKGWYALKGIGVTQGYTPDQPIKFSHKLHAGQNGIACLYCHSGADKGKVAGVPSLNVCMNCHKYVKQGPTGDKEEIAKIYAALDYDPDKDSYGPNPKPIQWTRVHNLPDLAYFNHSQHVAVGGIDCTTCHGPVKDSMTVVGQYSMLTMGWCIDCHRKTPVNMKDNAYYDDIHKDLLNKYGKDSLITVETIGGLECSRCHY